MGAHPIDLEARALIAYKRTGAIRGVDGAHCETFNDRLHVVVTRWGAAMAVYALRANGRLRRIWRWPNTIW